MSFGCEFGVRSFSYEFSRFGGKKSQFISTRTINPEEKEPHEALGIKPPPRKRLRSEMLDTNPSSCSAVPNANSNASSSSSTPPLKAASELSPLKLTSDANNGSSHPDSAISQTSPSDSNLHAFSNGVSEKSVFEEALLAITPPTTIKYLCPFDTDIIRLTVQYLQHLGLNRSASLLSHESGIFENPIATRLRKHVAEGKWDNAENDINSLIPLLKSEPPPLSPDEPSNRRNAPITLTQAEKFVRQITASVRPPKIDEFRSKGALVTDPVPKNSNIPSSLKKKHTDTSLDEILRKMLFVIREQKMLEFLEEDKVIDALTVLQRELTPLKLNRERINVLCYCLMVRQKQALYKTSGWQGTSLESRKAVFDRLQKFLPPSIILPPNRLRTLMQQALKYQYSTCKLHDSSLPNSLNWDNANSKRFAHMESPSLLQDHVCSDEDFPSTCIFTICDHTDEVWFTRFSNHGEYLATGGKDNLVVLYRVDMETLQCRKIRQMDGFSCGASFLAFSPNDELLAVCGPDDSSEVVIYEVQSGKVRTRVNRFPEDSLTCVAFHPTSEKFVTGGTRGQFFQCDLDGQTLDTWEGVRVQSLAYMANGHSVLAADTLFRIRVYDFEDYSDRHLLDEDRAIMSFTCDKQTRRALLNIATQGVHLWDLQTQTLIRKFQEVTQGFYTIHSCFGGNNQQFVASGSEDKNVYIWHVERSTPVAVLNGHSRTVNCVHWHPKAPLLASASDDGTVKLWAPSRYANLSSNESVSSSSTPDTCASSSCSSSRAIFASNGVECSTPQNFP